ncbi:hypothetical protein [Enterococcus sp. AZ163]|uniref:hypothetical protein n=1 Tax=Enterococcus sp. AZ163 TaxID=2774638 RepID=UPI003D285C9C
MIERFAFVVGMEYLTGQTEDQANAGTWLVRREKNWIVDFDRRVDSEKAAREMIAREIAKRIKQQLYADRV